MPELYLTAALLSGVVWVYICWKTSQELIYPLMDPEYKARSTPVRLAMVFSIYGFAFLTAYFLVMLYFAVR